MSVSVTVRFFASLREAVNCAAMELDVAEASVAGVRAQLAARLTKAQFEAIATAGVRVAVNQAIVEDDACLGSGDEVAFLPPVTGG